MGVVVLLKKFLFWCLQLYPLFSQDRQDPKITLWERDLYLWLPVVKLMNILFSFFVKDPPIFINITILAKHIGYQTIDRLNQICNLVHVHACAYMHAWMGTRYKCLYW